MTEADQGQENREHPRFEVSAYVDYTGAELLLHHRVENISLGGISIRTNSVEEPGTVVDLVINFPDLDATVAIQGEVAWLDRTGAMNMGIRFLELDDERRETLSRYLKRIRKA